MGGRPAPHPVGHAGAQRGRIWTLAAAAQDHLAARRWAPDLASAPNFTHEAQFLTPAAIASDAFADLTASWNALGVDNYAAGTCRRRTFSTLTQAAAHQPLRLDPHHALFQPSQVNSINGGIDRRFAPIDAKVLANALFQEVMHHGLRLATVAEASHRRRWRWHVEAQQLRVEATAAAAGDPTPEGIHQDGRDYVLMMLMGRQNIEGGCSALYTLRHRHLAQFTMSRPSELLMVADRHLKHAVSQITCAPGCWRGHRDMLIFSFVNLEHPDALLKNVHIAADRGIGAARGG